VSRRYTPSDTRISLFSFQDIITSITGIMVLIVLLLVLNMLNRKPQEMAPAHVHQSPKALRQEISELAKEVEKLRQQVGTGKARLARVCAMDADEMARNIAVEKARQKWFETQIAQVNTDLSTCRKNAENAATEKEALEIELKEQKKALKKAKVHVACVPFVSSMRTDKTPILVECSRFGINALVFGAAREKHEFNDPKSIEYLSALRHFLTWVRTRRNANDAFVVLVKPSAAVYAMEVVKKLRTLGFDVGYEPFEEKASAAFGG